MEENKSQHWDESCPCCKKRQDYTGTPEDGSDHWVYNYTCNNCKSTWTVNFGDKMGGGFDSVYNIVHREATVDDVFTKSAKFYIKIADDAFDKHVSNKLLPILTPEAVQMWKTGYLTAYIEFQKRHNESSKN